MQSLCWGTIRYLYLYLYYYSIIASSYEVGVATAGNSICLIRQTFDISCPSKRKPQISFSSRAEIEPATFRSLMRKPLHYTHSKGGTSVTPRSLVRTNHMSWSCTVSVFR